MGIGARHLEPVVWSVGSIEMYGVLAWPGAV